jgi:hypothetical protein
MPIVLLGLGEVAVGGAEAVAVGGEAVAAGGEAAAAGGEAAAAGAEGAEGAEEAESAAEGEDDEEVSKRGQRKKDRGKKERQTKHVTITKTVDRLDDLLKALKEFSRERVLVGVAADTAQREDGGPINNATIGLIMEKGSPAANIPARPWLAPGIMSARTAVLSVYLTATRRAFRTYSGAPIHVAHARAGAIARDAVKKYIKSANFQPLAKSTVAARFRQRGAKRRRKSETQYLAAVAGGMPADKAQGLYGIQPLINSGTFLNSVTYAVRPKSAMAL